MSRHRTALLALTALAATLGLFAATASPASAWSIVDLPPGFTANHIVIVDGVPCPSGYVIFGPGFIRTDADGSGLLCENSPTFQADVDAWVTAHYTAPVTPTVTPPVTPPVDPPATPPDTTPAAPPVTPAPVIVYVTDPVLVQQVTDLTAKVDALTTKVDALAAATTASWDAFVAAIDAGASAPDAALAARSAGMNALFNLG